MTYNDLSNSSHRVIIKPIALAWPALDRASGVWEQDARFGFVA